MRSSDQTIADAVEAGRRRLSGRSDTPWLDARLLTSHITGLDASAVIAYGDNLLVPGLQRRLDALFERRARGEPVAYLIGHKEFYGLRLSVDSSVLVPRAETETLVTAVIEDWRGTAPRILDMGTGSGAIACALAHALGGAAVLATDVSAQALAVAKKNVKRLHLEGRVGLAIGDLFAAVPVELRFDVIVANLPYVGEADREALADNVRLHEPAIALLAGADGLDVYRRMLTDAPRYVTDRGSIYCECSAFNARQLAALGQRAFPQARVCVLKDSAGLERVVAVRWRPPRRAVGRRRV